MISPARVDPCRSCGQGVPMVSTVRGSWHGICCRCGTRHSEYPPYPGPTNKFDQDIARWEDDGGK